MQLQNKRKQEEEAKSSKALAEAHSAGSAQRRWFKLTAGINGILPASGGPLPFIPLLALSQRRCALKE